MIRLTLLLCASIFLVLLVGGRDGPMTSDAGPSGPLVPEVQMSSLDATPASFAAEAAEPAPPPPVRGTQVAPGLRILPPPDQPAAPRRVEPAADEGMVRYVNVRRVNVRSGPSTRHPVIGTLDLGEAALVTAPDPAGGWAEIRIEGDGLSGWVAARYLSPRPRN